MPYDPTDGPPAAPHPARTRSHRPPTLEHPPSSATRPLAVVAGTLAWSQDRVLSKIEGLSDAAVRTPPAPLRWSPLGMIRHLTWVERRWMRWGFLGQDVDPYPVDGDEWRIAADRPSMSVLADYRAEIAHSAQLVENAEFGTSSRPGGRFDATEPLPTLGRILAHLTQEYARHLGHLDVARELIDGMTGE